MYDLFCEIITVFRCQADSDNNSEHHSRFKCYVCFQCVQPDNRHKSTEIIGWIMKMFRLAVVN